MVRMNSFLQFFIYSLSQIAGSLTHLLLLLQQATQLFAFQLLLPSCARQSASDNRIKGDSFFFAARNSLSHVLIVSLDGGVSLSVSRCVSLSLSPLSCLL